MTWMISIGRYTCMDVLRQRRYPRDLDGADEPLVSEGPGPQQAALALADKQQLDRCLSELDDAHRATIQLAYFHGLSHHQLTVALRAPLGTVKSWIRRGVEYLKRCLER